MVAKIIMDYLEPLRIGHAHTQRSPSAIIFSHNLHPHHLPPWRQTVLKRQLQSKSEALLFLWRTHIAAVDSASIFLSSSFGVVRQCVICIFSPLS